MDTYSNGGPHRTRLQRIARRAMVERGLLVDFSPAVLGELERLEASSSIAEDESIRDLRDLLWASIDNEDSRDLDQLTVAERLSGDAIKIFVAVADVGSLVKGGSAIDQHARANTTSVYTVAQIFSMLPEKLSTGLTSLNIHEDRLAVVVEMSFDPDGVLKASDIYRARVRNHAKLAYNSVAAWLEGNAGAPKEIDAVVGLDENIRLQDVAAQMLRNSRRLHGALTFETIAAKPVFDGDRISNIEVEKKNRAKELIEDFMIAANGVTARFLSSKETPSIRRVVRTPKRWPRIVELAKLHGFVLPADPDPKALDEFLIREKAADPLRFPDLSLAVIKLLGSGEYLAELPGALSPGHFGLAVKDYTHSTAPNRRYPDLVTQRLVKAAIEGSALPYAFEELAEMASHFTAQEDAANKVERQVEKAAAALLLELKVGWTFDAIVTGASEKGTWARLINIPVEGKIVQDYRGLDVGDRVQLKLLSVDVERGFIDFKKIG